ncbi:hypothetical protein MTR62_07325 [Novosphingobium sp. 1949]|uniref:Uncharacterized protein n=1 Tax=Novosphingobium organovorum TaxID=2930092 RepID=A0ABT0BBR8_9SPHN|nr:hypothetical protein [Novosphingobium organovorum]MCJ2182501.1 hypothetical protein [Novosphingobium organovorum]
MIARRALTGLALGLLAASPVSARAPAPIDPGTDLVHSDVPLWGTGDPDFYPQNFTGKDSWGRSSRIAIGDWRFAPNSAVFGDGTEFAAEWWRLANYGVFHCAFVEQRSDQPFADLSSDERAALAVDYSWIVRIGTLSHKGRKWELWDLQSGARTGSAHTLLLRDPAIGSGLIKRFEVLQRHCPARFQRQGVPIDIWKTRYCAINTREDLIAFARAMARKPVLGTLAWLGPAPSQDDTPEEGPSHGGAPSPR